LPDLLTAAFYYDRVHQLDKPVAYVDHNQSSHHTHLIGGKPNSIPFVHSLRHILQNSANNIINFHHTSAFFEQYVIVL
jgi:hypothetical protein